LYYPKIETLFYITNVILTDSEGQQRVNLNVNHRDKRNSCNSHLLDYGEPKRK